MYRLAEYEEGSPLYKYLSALASENIHKALENVFGTTPSESAFVYEIRFSEDYLGTDFFEGLSSHIKERAEVTLDLTQRPYTEDAKAGIELLRRTWCYTRRQRLSIHSLLCVASSHSAGMLSYP